MLPSESESFESAVDISGASRVLEAILSWAGWLGAKSWMKIPGCSCKESASEYKARENKASENTDLGKMGMHLVLSPKQKLVL